MSYISEDNSCSFPPTAKGCSNLVTSVLELNKMGKNEIKAYEV